MNPVDAASIIVTSIITTRVTHCLMRVPPSLNLAVDSIFLSVDDRTLRYVTANLCFDCC